MPTGTVEGLTRRCDCRGLPALEYAFRLIEGRDAPARHDGCLVTGLAQGAADRGREWNVPAEGPALVREHRRHALVARWTGVRIDRCADFRLLGIFEPAALGDGEVVDAGF